MYTIVFILTKILWKVSRVKLSKKIFIERMVEGLVSCGESRNKEDLK